MEQFNLEEWLKNRSRKVMTRDGRSVRIVCWDKLDDRPAAKEQKIVALVKEGCKENVFMYNDNGDGCISALDLFFADKEEELTELQKTLEEDCDCYVNLYNGGKTREELREWIKGWCPRIIDLAKKELEKSNPYSGNQKQEWSEDDKKMKSLIISTLTSMGTLNLERYHHMNLDEVKNWFKSLKDRVQPQPKQEWSEEDKSMYIRTLGILGKCYMGELPTKVEEELNWLKSIELQSHWKPSEEQMEALFEAKLASIKNREYFLGLLYEDLKKL